MPSLLVVDDDNRIRELLEFQLQDQYDLEVCPDGRTAWEYLLANDDDPPDVVVLDVMMPGMDGFQVLERIENDDRFEDVDVIMLTARGRDEDVVRALESGATDFVTKPLSSSELTARIERTIG